MALAGSAAPTPSLKAIHLRRNRRWTTTWTDGTATTTAPNGDVIASVMDGRGRNGHRTFQPGSVVGGTPDLMGVSYSFDGDDLPLLLREERHSGNVDNTFGYDDRNRVTSLVRGGDTVSYTYFTDDQPQTTTTPSGVVTYGYDTHHRPSSVYSKPTSGVNTSTKSLTWEAGGGRLQLIQDATTEERWCYDSRGRVSAVVNAPKDGTTPTCGLNTGASALISFQYSYDDRGNRLTEDYRDSTGTNEQTGYGFDLADRLTGVRYGTSKSVLYSLGGDGSRLGEKTVNGAVFTLGPDAYASTVANEEWAYRYGLQGHNDGVLDRIDRVLGVGGSTVATYASDENGRVKQAQRDGLTNTYTWDVDDRLIGAKVQTGTTSSSYQFTYDAQGWRRLESGPNGTNRYIWGAGEVVEEQRAGQKLIYERAGGQAIAAGGSRFLHDGLGSIAGRLPSSGSATFSRMDAWGNFRDDANHAAPAAGEPSLAYAGQHWDADLGLSYAQQWWMDPSTGRFLSEDPLGPEGRIGAPGGLHTFGYASANPLQFADSNGLDPGAACFPGEPQTRCGERLRRTGRDWGTWADTSIARFQEARPAYEPDWTDKVLSLLTGGGWSIGQAWGHDRDEILAANKSEGSDLSVGDEFGVGTVAAGTTALQATGLRGLYEGIRDRDLVSGRKLGIEESYSRGMSGVAGLAQTSLMFLGGEGGQPRKASAAAILPEQLAADALVSSERGLSVSPSIEGDLDLVSVSGAAQAPRLQPWVKNAAGPRTLEQAIELARQHGIEIGDDVAIRITDFGIPDRAYASYLDLGQMRGDRRITWSDFIHDKFDAIPVRVRPSVLESDEAILAVFGHEMHEINRLRTLFETSESQSMRAGEVSRLICEGVPGNLHDEAWDVADDLVRQYRKGNGDGSQ